MNLLFYTVLHHQKIEVFHIGVIVGESTVHGGHLGHGLVEDEGTFAGFIDKLVLVFKSIDITYHLAQPGAGNLVLELRAGNLQRLLGAGGQQQEKKGYEKILFHCTSDALE